MHFAFVTLITGLLCATTLSAQGQTRVEEAQQRNACRLANQVVRTGHPAPHREWAYSVISQCEQSGPAALAAVWLGEKPLATGELTFLARATHDLRDRRLYVALRTAGRDARTDVEARLHALALLLDYVSPHGLYFEPADLRMPVDGPAPPMRFVTHDDPVLGSEPAGDVRDDLRAYYTGLRESDPDPVIRNAARILVKHIR